MKASAAALRSHVSGLDTCALQPFCNDLKRLLEEGVSTPRLTLPTMRTLLCLLESGLLVPLLSPGKGEECAGEGGSSLTSELCGVIRPVMTTARDVAAICSALNLQARSKGEGGGR